MDNKKTFICHGKLLFSHNTQVVGFSLIQDVKDTEVEVKMIQNREIKKILKSVELLHNVLGISMKRQAFGEAKSRVTSRLVVCLSFLISFAAISVAVMKFKQNDLSVPALTEIFAVTSK